MRFQPIWSATCPQSTLDTTTSFGTETCRASRKVKAAAWPGTAKPIHVTLRAIRCGISNYLFYTISTRYHRYEEQSEDLVTVYTDLNA
jgi:hypothetical protein